MREVFQVKSRVKKQLRNRKRRLQRLFDEHMLVVRPHEIGTEPERIERAAQRPDDLQQIAARREALTAIFRIVTIGVAPFAANLGKFGCDRRDTIGQFGPIRVGCPDHRPSRCQNSCALTRRLSAGCGSQDGCGRGCDWVD